MWWITRPKYHDNHESQHLKVVAKFNETGEVIEVTESKQLTILKQPDDNFWHIPPMLQNRNKPIERQIIIRNRGLEVFQRKPKEKF